MAALGRVLGQLLTDLGIDLISEGKINTKPYHDAGISLKQYLGQLRADLGINLISAEKITISYHHTGISLYYFSLNHVAEQIPCDNISSIYAQPNMNSHYDVVYKFIFLLARI